MFVFWTDKCAETSEPSYTIESPHLDGLLLPSQSGLIADNIIKPAANAVGFNNKRGVLISILKSNKQHLIEVNGLADIGHTNDGRRLYIYDIPLVPFLHDKLQDELEDESIKSPKYLERAHDDFNGYEYKIPENPIQIPDKSN